MTGAARVHTTRPLPRTSRISQRSRCAPLSRSRNTPAAPLPSNRQPRTVGLVFGPASRPDCPVPVTTHSSISGRCGVSSTRMPTTASVTVTRRTVASLAPSICTAFICTRSTAPPLIRRTDRPVTRTPCSGVPVMVQSARSAVTAPLMCTAVKPDRSMAHRLSEADDSSQRKIPLAPEPATVHSTASSLAESRMTRPVLPLPVTSQPDSSILLCPAPQTPELPAAVSLPPRTRTCVSASASRALPAARVIVQSVSSMPCGRSALSSAVCFPTAGPDATNGALPAACSPSPARSRSRLPTTRRLAAPSVTRPLPPPSAMSQSSTAARAVSRRLQPGTGDPDQASTSQIGLAGLGEDEAGTVDVLDRAPGQPQPRVAGRVHARA